MNCSNCGKEIKPGTKFCNSCGKQVNVQGQVIEENESVYRTEYNPREEAGYVPEFEYDSAYRRDVVKKKTGSLSIVLITLLVIAVIGCVVALCFVVYNMGVSDRNESEIERNIDDEEDEKTIEEEDSEEIAEDEIEEEEKEDREEQQKQDREAIESDYFFPSDRVYITEADLRGKTKSEVGYLRNEIYARHGYMFKTEPYKTYFSQKDWYTPNPYFSEDLFNSVEKANKSFLVEYEKYMGWR